MCQTIPMAELLAKNRTDPGFVAGYTEVDYSGVGAMLRARIAAGLTQAEVAPRTGTTTAAIARLEGGAVSPTVETQQKYAKAVGSGSGWRWCRVRDVTHLLGGRWCVLARTLRLAFGGQMVRARTHPTAS